MLVMVLKKSAETKEAKSDSSEKEGQDAPRLRPRILRDLESSTVVSGD